MDSLPVLYSFRRCPFAIRARIALAYADVCVELREVLLKNKPPEMLRASSKGTVPVLVLPDGRVLDESLDVMRWALQQSDPKGWLQDTEKAQYQDWVASNDGPFKAWLDKYKYAETFPGAGEELVSPSGRALFSGSGQPFAEAVMALWRRTGICRRRAVSVYPAFAGVEPAWFQEAPYPALRHWLEAWLSASLFAQVMHKQPPWAAGQPGVVFPRSTTSL